MSGEKVWVVHHEYDNGSSTSVCSSEEKAYELAAWLIIKNLYELEKLKDKEADDLIQQLCTRYVGREYREVYEAWDEFQESLSEREDYISIFEETVDPLSQEHLQSSRQEAFWKLGSVNTGVS